MIEKFDLLREVTPVIDCALKEMFLLYAFI